MSKVPVQASQVPDYIRITEALDKKFGHGNWRWAPWAFTRTEHGKVLGSPVVWQDINCHEGDGRVYTVAAVDAVPDWERQQR